MPSACRREVLAVMILCIVAGTFMTGCDVDWDAAMTEFRSTAVPSITTALGDLITAFLSGLSAVLTPNSSSSTST